ncbi:hypothetical protein [Kitasatospora sp. NPDC085879]|uniref:hypothetical protein n=1 Tax=Kitasatospora sp. NPDC085879 TaxID=3154769 RepID=UPI003449034E
MADMGDLPLASNEQLVFNGVDADTGEYLFAPMSLAALAERVRGIEPRGDQHQQDLRHRHHDDEEHLGVMYGRDPESLAAVGWALVTADGTDPRVLEALEPLRRHRRQEAGELYQELTVLPGDDCEQFRSRHGMGPGPADPRKIPYYLLLVGSPERIPFSFQYQLDVTYAVGRVHFDTAEEYASYAASVVAAENSPEPVAAEPRKPRVHLFGTRNPGDTPTALSASRLVEPMRAELGELAPGVGLTTDVGQGATKARLYDLLLDGAVPEVLFTATHGVGCSATGRRETQGALLCQDWPGPLMKPSRISCDHYLAGVDLPTDRPVVPRIVFSFCCYGAGTPRVADFPSPATNVGLFNDETPFIARLPQRLLGNPAGGSLGFIGHVDRAWSCSFLWAGLTPQIAAMASTLMAILDGVRMGSAMEFLNSRYAEISTELTAKLDEIKRYGLLVEDRDLAGLWTANNDARNFVLLGDPAVRAVRTTGT